jgi:2-aminoethylphosphonate-pyruvate transaminase
MTPADLILFTPGPVRIPPLVAQYLASPPCNYHRQDAFCAMFGKTERDLKQLVGIKAEGAYFATQLTATGTGANEACLLALEPLGRGLIVTNGFFGDRAVDQAKQNTIDAEIRRYPQDVPLDPDAIAKELDDSSIKWLFFVSHETRTGLANPFEEIGKRCKAKRPDLMIAADAISSAFAYPIDIEASQIDLVTASSAKAIMAAPGLGIVFTRKASVPLFPASKPRGYYLDVLDEYKKQSAEMQPRFAQPVALHAALRAACMHLTEVGIANHMARIQRQMKSLTDHLASLDLHPLLDARYRSNIAVNFRLPPNMRYSSFSKRMEELGYFCLYGIPKDESHFQLSTIGDLSEDHIRGVTSALSKVFGR